MKYRVLRNLRNALRRKPAEPAGAPGGRIKFAWEAVYPDDIEWRSPIPARPLFAALDDAVAKDAKATCIDFLGKRYTYGKIGNLVEKAAKGFQELGVRKGVKVGLLLPNTPYFIICYYAVPGRGHPTHPAPSPIPACSARRAHRSHRTWGPDRCEGAATRARCPFSLATVAVARALVAQVPRLMARLRPTATPTRRTRGEDEDGEERLDL